MERFKMIAVFCLLGLAFDSTTQSWKLTSENIDSAFRANAERLEQDPFRPAFHVTPPAGCMGDPNGGIYVDGWYHAFYGLQPFAFHPGGWYWAHARSQDLLRWEHLPPRLTPDFDLGLDAIGSGSTIITDDGKKVAFHSQRRGQGPMEFWRVEFTNEELSQWTHDGKNPVLTLDHPGVPAFDDFWRDPFVFSVDGRTFLIACADLLEESVVEVPIFEATNKALTSWEYRGPLLTLPKHRFRNLEVPELRPIGDQWIFLASTDAPHDRVNYFLGSFDLQTLRMTIAKEGAIDYSGHYYAQETILDDKGDLYLLSWLPGWDREWLPYYMNEPQKNSNPRWNGCFALPRQLMIEEGQLRQKPVESLKELREETFEIAPMDLPVTDAITALHVIKDFQSDQMELQLQLDLHSASFCGVSVLTDDEGRGGLPITWSGDQLNVDGVVVPMGNWDGQSTLKLRLFVDKKFVEVFVNDGLYCISRQLREENVKGDHITLTSLGGTARLVSLTGWTLGSIH